MLKEKLHVSVCTSLVYTRRNVPGDAEVERGACSPDRDGQWEWRFQGIIRPRPLPKLGENAVDVAVDCRLRYEQLVGNLRNR